MSEDSDIEDNIEEETFKSLMDIFNNDKNDEYVSLSKLSKKNKSLKNKEEKDLFVLNGIIDFTKNEIKILKNKIYDLGQELIEIKYNIPDDDDDGEPNENVILRYEGTIKGMKLFLKYLRGFLNELKLEGFDLSDKISLIKKNLLDNIKDYVSLKESFARMDEVSDEVRSKLMELHASGGFKLSKEQLDILNGNLNDEKYAQTKKLLSKMVEAASVMNPGERAIVAKKMRKAAGIIEKSDIVSGMAIGGLEAYGGKPKKAKKSKKPMKPNDGRRVWNKFVSDMAKDPKYAGMPRKELMAKASKKYQQLKNK